MKKNVNKYNSTLSDYMGGIISSVVLIDNHPVAAIGISTWLNGTGRFIVSGLAKNLTEASALMKQLEKPPDIIILDLSLGAEDGLDFIPILKEICLKRNIPMPGILVCSAYEDSFLIQRAINLGVRGFISKTVESAEFLAVIDMLLKGGNYFNPKYQTIKPKHSWSLLTRRENDIVACIKQNMNNKQIAKRLHVAVRTVENHLSHIYFKTGVVSRDELQEL